MTPQEAASLRSQYETLAEASTAAGISRHAYRRLLLKASEQGHFGFDPVMPGFAVKSVSSRAEDGAWVKQVQAHGEEFEVPEGHVVKGVSALVDAEGRQVLSWIKTKASNEPSVSTLQATLEAMKEELPRVAPTKGPARVSTNLLNQFTITDLHFGMLAWGEETGGADYDLKIAEQILLDWFSAAIAMAPNAHTAVLAQLGDLMHHDSLESVTPAHKHVLDADSRLQKVIRVVIRVVRQVIAMLLETHEHVHVLMASANHDPASSAWMREWLSIMYEDEPRISVDDSPDVYYSYQWGNTALFYHHGHKRRISDVDTVFAGKFRTLYGSCEHSYGHIGHLHNDALRESNLMRVERHRTLAPQDAYASSGGWLSKQDAKVITYHRQFGEVSRLTLSPAMVSAGDRSILH